MTCLSLVFPQGPEATQKTQEKKHTTCRASVMTSDRPCGLSVGRHKLGLSPEAPISISLPRCACRIVHTHIHEGEGGGERERSMAWRGHGMA